MDKDGCKSRDTVAVENKSFVVNVSSSKPVVCDGNVILTGTDPKTVGTGKGKGVWTIEYGNAAPLGTANTLYRISVSGLRDNDDRKTKFRWTIDDDCDNYAEIDITNNQVYANVLDDDVLTCKSFRNIEGNNPANQVGDVTGHWEFTNIPGGSTPSLDNANAFVTTVRGLKYNKITSLKWVVELGTCFDEAPAKIEYYVPNAYITTGDITHGCNDTVLLTAQSLPASATGEWTTTSSDPSISITTVDKISAVVRGLPIENTKFIWTVTDRGCTNQDEVIINNSKPENTVGTPYREQCDTVFTMDAQNPQDGNTGEWFVSAGNARNYTKSLCNTNITIDPGRVELKWRITESGGCFTDKNFVIVNNNPKNVNAGSPREVCANQVQLLAATLNPGEKGLWEVETLPDKGRSMLRTGSTIHNPIVQNLPQGITQFTWTVTSAKNCSISDKVAITNVKPEVTAGTQQDVCEPQVPLLGSVLKGGQTGKWTCDAPGVYFSNSVHNATEAFGLPGGNSTFTWTVYEGDCSNSADVKINYIQVTANAGNDRETCVDTISNLTAAVPSIGTGSWYKEDGSPAIIKNSLNNQTVVTNLIKGNNKFYWKVKFGICEAVDEVIVTNNELPPINAYTTTPSVCDGVAELQGTTPAEGQTGEWVKVTTDGTFDNPASNATSISGLALNENKVKWTLSKGKCKVESNEVVIQNNKVTANAWANKNLVCNGIVEIKADNPKVQNAKGYWVLSHASINIAESTEWKGINAKIDYRETGHFTWKVEKSGCRDEKDFYVENKEIHAEVNDTVVNVCGTNVILNAKDPAPDIGEWSVQGTYPSIKIRSPFVFNTEVDGVVGDKNFVWTVSNANCTSKKAYVMVRNKSIDLQEGSARTVCAHDSVATLVAAALRTGETGEWSYLGTTPIVSISTKTNVNTIVTGLHKGSNLFKWVVENGICSNQTTYTIDNIAPNQAVAGTYSPTCSDSIMLNAQPVTLGETGTWIPINPEPGLNIADIHDNNTSVTGLRYGDNLFRWRISSASDCYTDSVAIVKSYKLRADVTTDEITICNTDTARLIAVEPLNGKGRWILENASSYPTVTVNSINNYTAKASGMQVGKSYTFTWLVEDGKCSASKNVKVINNTPSVANAGNDKDICKSKTHLSAIQPTIGVGHWQKETATSTILEPSLYNTEVTLNPGTAKFIWIVEKNSCISSDTVEISNNSYVINANADMPVVCDGLITLTGTDPATVGTGKGKGIWTIEHGEAYLVKSADSSSPVAAFERLRTNSDRQTTFKWTIEDKCTESAQITITNNQVVSNIATDSIFSCDNFTSILAENPQIQGTNVKGYWDFVYTAGGNPTFDNASNFHTTVRDLAENATTKLKWVVELGKCSDEKIMEIEYYKPQALILTGSAPHGCEDSIVLNATDIPSSAVGIWTTTASASSIKINSASNISTLVTGLPLGNTDFAWTVRDRGCESVDNIIINNSKPINSIGTPLQEGCIGTFVMDAQEPPSGSTGRWEIISGNVISYNSTLCNTTFVITPGKVDLEWIITEAGGCSTSKAFTINNKKPRDVNAGIDIDNLCSNTIQLSATEAAVGQTGVWTVPAMPDNGAALLGEGSLLNNPVVNNLPKGITTFRWTVTNNSTSCSDFDDVKIENITPDANAGSDQVVCGTSTQLSAKLLGPGEVGVWSCENDDVEIINSDRRVTSVRKLPGGGATTFTWTVSSPQCPDVTDQVKVEGISIKVSAGANYSDCADSIVLDGTKFNGDWQTGYWEIVNSSGGTGAAFIKDSKSPMTYAANLGHLTQFKWTLINSKYPDCEASGLMTFTNLLPTKAEINMGDSAKLCRDSIFLSAIEPDASKGETGKWTLTDGAGSETSIEHENLPKTWVRKLPIGQTKITWSVSNSRCTSEDVIVVRNDQVFAEAGDDITTCELTQTVQTPDYDSRYDGVWSCNRSEVTFTTPSNYSSMVQNLQFGENIITWTVSSKENSACKASDYLIITNNQPRNVSAGNDTTICGTQVELTASPPPGNGYGVWTRSIGVSGTATPNSLAHTTIVDLGQDNTIFKWTVHVGECSASDEVKITNKQFDISAGRSESVCTDYHQINGATPPDGSGQTGKWTVIVGGNTTSFDDDGKYNTTVRNLGKGINILQWTITDSNGSCAGSAEVAITNDTPTEARIIGTYPDVICQDSLKLSAQAPDKGVGRWIAKGAGGTFDEPTSHNTYVRNIPSEANRVNIFTWEVRHNNCVSDTSITVINNSIPKQISVDKLTVCNAAHETVVSANDLTDGRVGEWTAINPTSVVIEEKNKSVTRVKDLLYGRTRLRWRVESADGVCSREDEVEIINNYKRDVTAISTSSGPLCKDSDVIQGSLPPQGTYGYWKATSLDVEFEDSNSYFTKVSNLPNSKCDVTWTIVTDGCEAPSPKLPLINRQIDVHAGVDDVTCNGAYTLGAPKLRPGQTGKWTADNTQVVFGNSANSPTARVTDLVVGTNVFTWTVTDAYCSSSADVVISNNVFHVTAGADRNNCGPVVKLEGSNPLSGEGIWSTEGAGGGEFVSRTLYNTEVRGLLNGKNTFRWTVKRNGCEASAAVTIDNIKYEAKLGEGREVCGDRATITGNFYEGVPGLRGRWDVMGGTGYFDADSRSPVAMVKGLQKGENTIRWTLGVEGEGCEHYDFMKITNIASASKVANTPIITCDNFQEIMATPLAAGERGYWTAGGEGVRIDNTSATRTTVRELLQGKNTFTWTTIKGECRSESQQVVVSNYFVPNAGPDQLLKVDSANMHAMLPEQATGRWILTGGTGNIAPEHENDTSALVTKLGQGRNTFKWEVTWNSCINSDYVDIIYNTLEADAGKDTTICSDKMFLNAKKAYPAVGTWSVVEGYAKIKDPHNERTEISGLKPGSLTELKWEVSINGYSIYDNVFITNGEFETSAGQDKEFCVDSTVLAAEPAGPNGIGTWEIVTGAGSLANTSLSNTTVKSLDPGPNVLRWTVVKNTGCVSSATVTLTYNLPPISNFTTNVEAGCSPLNVNYENTSTGGVKYYWLFGEDQREDTVLTSFDREYVAFDKDSIYSTRLITVSDKNCVDTVIKHFTVYGIPHVNFEAYPEFQIYPDATVHIDNYSDEGYENYYWTFGDGGTKVDTERETGFSHMYDKWGEYVVSLAVNSGNCNDTVSKKIVIAAPEPKDQGGRKWDKCAPLNVNFRANILYSDSAYWVINRIGDMLQEADTLLGHEPSFLFDKPGTYLANLWATGPGMKNGEMKFMRTDTVVVYPVPTANFLVSPDTVMLPNQSVHCYNRSIGADTYDWDFGDESEISNKENPEHYYLKEGKYSITLKVYTEHECYDDTTYHRPIIVEPPGICVFPNAFTPSKAGATDGRYDPEAVNNDVFHPVYRGVKEYKLEIFNRWGAKIFESNDPAIGWDGYVNGRLLDQDVYVWKVTGKYKNDVNFHDTGDCTLLH